MEILEDVLKNDKKLVTTKRGSCDQFLTKIKISDPNKARDGWIQKFFLIDFDIWNVKIRVRMRKRNQFYELTPNSRTKWEQCAQNWSWQQGFDGNSEDKYNKLDGVDQGLMDIKETQQDLKVFTDYDEKQRERHKLD